MKKELSFRHFFIPNVSLVLFFILFLPFFRADNHFLTDPATARHLITGEWMLQRHQVFHTDPFTFWSPPLPWIDFEWLFEVFAAFLNQIGGLPLVYGAGFFLFSLISVGLWRLLINQNISWPIALLYTLMATVIFKAHFLFRPFIFTYLFMLLFLHFWHRSSPKLNFSRSLPLMLLFLFWCNLHSGFLAALLFLVFSLAGRKIDQLIVQNQKKEMPEENLSRWLFFILAILAVTLLNPYGWRLDAKLIEIIFWIQSVSSLDESASLNFASPNALTIGFLIIMGTLFAGRIIKRKWYWESALPVLVFLFFALRTQRHVLLLLLVAAIPVCQDWESILKKIGQEKILFRFNRFGIIEKESRSHYWLIPFCGAIAFFLFCKMPQANSLRVGAWNLSAEAVAFLKKNQMEFQRPLTTTWNGGPFLFYLAPQCKNSFDDRIDLFGDRMLESYLDLLNLKPGWQQILLAGKYDSAVLDRGIPLTGELSHLQGWKKVYEDQLSVFFIKRAEKDGLPNF